MSELKLPRLLAAAKEFNIGQDTLIEFLVKKGFDREELKPTAKLTEDMYRSLQSEFQSDKVAKNKADQVEIPRGMQGDEEEISFRKEEKKPAAPAPEPVETPAPAPVVEAPVPAPVPEPEVVAPVVETPAPAAPAEPAVVKIDVPELEGPKIINKIDLDALDTSTRPKKTAKKAAPAPAPAPEPVAEAPAPAPVVEKAPEPTPAPAAPAEEAPAIMNIEVEKLTGPKILGKIELPVDSDTRPKPAAKDEKRKRKRIPIEKKGPGTGGDQPQQQQSSGGGSNFSIRRGPDGKPSFSRPGGPQGGRQRNRRKRNSG
jgi:translation initiation factor IF-2